MDLEHVQRLAQAFAQGVAFSRGFTEMAQDAKDGEEEGHWVTIGGERGADGEKHGGRPVFISGNGTIKKGLSKSAQGKTLGQVFGKGGEFSSEGGKSKAESKKAEKENLSYREMVRHHSEQKAAEAEREAGRSAEEKDKAAQLSNKLNTGLFSYYDGLSYAADNLDRKAAKALADKAGDNEALQNALWSIRSTVRTSKMFMRDYYRRIVDAAGKGKIDNARAAKEFDKYKSLSNKVANIADSAMDQISELRRLNHDKVAQAITELSRQNEAIQDTIRGQVQGLENANTPETAREAGLRMQRAGKEAGKRASTKRAEAEKDRKDATSRAKEFRQETKQIVANDLEPSVAKLKKALDVRPLPASVHDDLVDMHRLADQIGIMANKLCSLNSRWAENSKEPSAFVVSSHGQNAKGTAERVAQLSRQSAAIARDFGTPNNERAYPGLSAHDKIRDNLSELRGLHQDLLDHIRRIQEPEKREEPQEDPLYAARGKVINGSRAESKKAESKPAQQETETVKALKDAYNVSADQIDEMAPKQKDRPFLNRLDRIHKDAVALAESAPEISNSHELREMTRIMKLADKLVKALPSYYDRNYYGGWVQNLMGKVRVAEEAYTKLKERKARGPNAAI